MHSSNFGRASRMTRLACGLAGLLVLAWGTAALGQAPGAQTIRLICLPGVPMAVVAAQAHGIFAKYGVDVHAEEAKDAIQVRNDLIAGKADLAESAVENAVEAATGGSDVIIVRGGEAITSEFIVQKDIASIKDLKGKTVISDGEDTEYTLAIKKIMALNGLKPGTDYELKMIGTSRARLKAMTEHPEYAATVQKPPTSVLSQHAGLVSLGPTQKLMGMERSQGLGAFVRRDWAKEHSDLLERYIAGYIEGQRWLMAPANKTEVTAMIAKEQKIDPDVAAATYDIAVKSAWQPDGRFDPEGLRNALKLRAEMQSTEGSKPPAADKLYDLSYSQKALKMVN